MIKVLALYGIPADAEAFDEYYFSRHVPLAKTLPGLRGYEVSRGDIRGVVDGSRPYHLIATLLFDSEQDLQTALGSPEGQKTAADLQNFASGGVTLLAYESGTA